jgi:uncharacterized protein (DUF2062 family)
MKIINYLKNKIDFSKLDLMFGIKNFWDIFRLSVLKKIFIYATTLKISDYNKSIAIAIGIFSTFFPLGTQGIIALILAKILKGNYILAVAVSLIHNPLTSLFFFGIVNNSSKKISTILFKNSENNKWIKKIISFTLSCIILGLIFGSLTFIVILSYLKIIKLIKNLDLKYDF